ncbi:MATE family efflux transporter [Roseimaritima ulvae]|uniref:Multidrug-efflux transporter n=2 Tax=Roseimaritima ulvae TaxID=980254 RepID=A0A5B9QWA0_9BACT|nr:MATE family efflux transporter [Roseimaritima ulvae]QEG41376.1 Multidrug resistance protein MdtK [Roseimaritima ulvae]
MNAWKHRFTGPAGILQVLRVALPLMISTGTFSLVLFIDRTLLLWYDGSAMSASMAAGNLFWALICLPFGLASMTGAFVAQYVGAGQQEKIGRLLWQSVWFALGTAPFFLILAVLAPWMFRASNQPPDLIALESMYLRILLVGAVGSVLDTALSGFFSGTERTQTIMWCSIATAAMNVVLDVGLVFGIGPLPELGIVGAGIASAICFWFKAILFAALIWYQADESLYGFRCGRVFDFPLLKRLVFYGLPAGLQFVVESGGFTLIVLQIGSLGDIPLRATTMAINFNMIAFIPLIGLSVATSVLVGRHLTQSGPALAQQVVWSALSLALTYSLAWTAIYLLVPDTLLSLYRMGNIDSGSEASLALARGLLGFVAMYVLFDATQLILAGALRGAGDTWFVLLGTTACSATALSIGHYFEPSDTALRWWWWAITSWVWMLAVTMLLRFIQGRWRSIDMIGKRDVDLLP